MTDLSDPRYLHRRLRHHHHRRIRLHARAVSLALAPLIILLLMVFLVFNMVACWGGAAPQVAVLICRRSWLMPVLPILLTVVETLFFLIALSEFADEILQQPRGAREWRVYHGLRCGRHAYRNLDDDLQASVIFAIEMMLWAAVTIAATLIYYWTNNAWLFGILSIAGGLRILYLLLRPLYDLMRRLLRP